MFTAHQMNVKLIGDFNMLSGAFGALLVLKLVEVGNLTWNQVFVPVYVEIALFIVKIIILTKIKQK